MTVADAFAVFVGKLFLNSDKLYKNKFCFVTNK